MMPYGWHAGGWGWLWMIGWLALIVGVVYLFVRPSAHEHSHEHPGGGGGGASRDPLNILEERFARGEISEQEFRERREVLEKSRL